MNETSQLALLFGDFSRRRTKYWRGHDHGTPEDKNRRNYWEATQLPQFGASVAKLLGVQYTKTKLVSATQTAFQQAKTRDQAEQVRKAALASLQARYPKGGRKFNKYVKRTEAYYTKRITDIDKAFAAATNGTTGNPTGVPAGSTGGTPPAPKPTTPTAKLAPPVEDDNTGPDVATVLLFGMAAFLAYKVLKSV